MSKDTITKPQFVDYFNPEKVFYSFKFPDGYTELTFRKLTEGDRAALQNRRSEIVVNRKTNDMKFDGSTGTVKMEVITLALTDWNLQTINQKGEAVRVPFERSNIEQLLKNLDPSLIDAVYAKVVEYNDWLEPVSKSETIQKEIEKLQTELDKAKSEEKK